MEKKDEKWKFSNEFLSLSDEEIQAVPDIETNPGLVAIGERIRNFEAQKKVIAEAVANCRNYPSDKPRATLPAAEIDAQALLDGAEPASLSGPDDIDHKRNLQRQLKAIEAAISILQEQQRELIAKLASDACQEITPVANKIAGDTFECLENLLSQLEKQRQFYSLLDRKGLPSTRRDAHWCLTAFEDRLLFGGLGQPTLRWFIDERKKYWGL